ncbi:zinc finger CCCH domain-containing protein 19 [Selaginella moellendorffii]|uniref:zinc finger CCCH domain-containing protein 19 n=1 Tax=Selaginella moellendorffii TaxID=88036 RepID=UPI000D1CE88F|nr:zinc finger CCCH domain-containing protein 19 [Selaginella moellendorffii]|eukprot:XP_024531612.1 zinc finger CCCH domain-containing protein 19 [Selaginella moellendorffii]
MDDEQEQEQRLELEVAAAVDGSKDGNGVAEMERDENLGAVEQAGEEKIVSGEQVKEELSGKLEESPAAADGMEVSEQDEAPAKDGAATFGENCEEKTELQREMELFEAAEKEDEANILSKANEKKRAQEQPAQESRKKRGRKASVKASFRKEEDDVCFVCFDGGDLILCDQRTCPKAYHLGCIGRDQEFFRKKGNWHCGWHFCDGENCSKKASFRCYTCPKAYCAGCRSRHSFSLFDKKKGLCEECVNYVKMIELNETVNAEGNTVDFNDRDTYECLFKEYWEDLKAKETIVLPEFDKDGKFVNATPAADSDGRSDDEASSSESETSAAVVMADDEDVPFGTGIRKERKTKILNALSDEFKCTVNQEQKEQPLTEDVDEKGEDEEEEEEQDEEEEEEGEAYKPTVFDGWASKEMISFIKFMKEDPKTPMKRPAVNKLLWDHIKANKLQNPRKKTIIRCDEQLRSLFGKKAVTQRSLMKYLHNHFPSKASKTEQAESQVDDEKGKKNKRSLKGDEYAAINQSNISHVYLRRALLEDMLGDPNFEQKVVGTFVRIRVPGKNDMCYRLVQIVGTRLQAEEYKAGKKSTKIVLLITNLQKKEDLTIDLVSNQDFTEEECARLRQSIKWGFIPAPTVGDFERKALSIREAKLNDWFETETSRLTALRDRANEKGRKKELRECVEKLQRISNQDYRLKELSKVPAFEADATMDPEHEEPSDEPNPTEQPAEVASTAEKSRSIREEHQPNKWDRRNDPPAFTKQDSFNKRDGFERGWDRDHDWRNEGRSNGKFGGHKSAEQKEPVYGGGSLPLSRPPPPPPRPPHLSTPPANMNAPPPPEIAEKEKAWFYQDPKAIVQGPFSFEQLRKWSLTGLFPADLKVWRSGQREQAVLLVEALAAARTPVAAPAAAWGAPPPPALDTGRTGGWDNTGGGRSGWNASSRTGDWSSTGGHERVGGGAPSPPSDPWSQNPGRSDGGGGGGGNFNDGPWGAPPQAPHRSPGWRDQSQNSGWVDRGDSFRSPRVPHQQKKGTPCRFYQKGFCRNGDSCPFQHS